MKEARNILMLAAAVVMAFATVFTAGAQTASQTTLRMMWWGGDDRHKATIAAINAYQKLHPDVVIRGEYGGFDGYDQKIKLQLASRTAPDIVQLDQPWLAELQQKGNFFVDFSHQPGIDLSGYDANYLKSYCSINNALIALPTGLGGQDLLVNKTGATKAGVDFSKLSDWQTILAEGKRLHAKNPRFYMLAHDIPSNYWFIQSFLKQLTGKPVILDDYSLGFTKADITKVFAWVSEAVSSGLFQAPGEAALYPGKLAQNPLWSQQNQVMTFDWASNITSYKSVLPKDTEYVMLPMPKISGAKTGSTTLRPSQVVAVNQQSGHVAEAVKFLNWFLNDSEAAVILGDVRGVPASRKAREAVKAAKKVDELALDAIENATKNQSLPDSALTHNSQIDEIFKDVGVKAEFGTLKPEQAADELITRLTAKLKSLKAAAK